MKKRAYFITSTGTDIGKTYLTCQLLRALGKQSAAIKPVISDFSEDKTSDTSAILAAMAQAFTPANINTVSPWRFEPPLSPDMAARMVNQTIEFPELLDFCTTFIEQTPEYAFIEGVGGAFVPFNEEHSFIDIAQALSLPAILITGSYLGTLGHTLATLTALAASEIKVQAIVLNSSPDCDIPLAETQQSLENFTDTPIVTLQRFDDANELQDLSALIKHL